MRGNPAAIPYFFPHRRCGTQIPAPPLRSTLLCRKGSCWLTYLGQDGSSAGQSPRLTPRPGLSLTRVNPAPTPPIWTLDAVLSSEMEAGSCCLNEILLRWSSETLMNGFWSDPTTLISTCVFTSATLGTIAPNGFDITFATRSSLLHHA